MICNVMSISTVFQSYQDKERFDNEKLCGLELCLWLRRFRLKLGSNSELLDQQASTLPTELPGLLGHFTVNGYSAIYLFSAILQRETSFILVSSLNDIAWSK